MKLSYQQQKELEKLTVELPLLEKELQEIKEKFNQVDLDYTLIKSLTEKQENLEAILDEKTERWMELSEILEESQK